MSNDFIDKILRDCLKHSFPIYERVLKEITNELRRSVFDAKRLRKMLDGSLKKLMPVSSQILGDAIIAAVMGGNQAILSRFGANASGPSDKLPSNVLDPFGFTAKRFPIIENSVRAAGGRKAVSPDVFYRALPEARRYALFTVKGLKKSSVAKVQIALTKTIDKSTSLRQFKRNVAEVLGKSALAPAHMEQVYRNAVNTAFADGNDIAHDDNPFITNAMPYVAYHAIRDARARPEHLAMEFRGIQGTNVYWYADPVIRLFRPPWSWNCRCGRTFLTIRQAAKIGIKEAIEWLETGKEPKHELVKMPPWKPPQGWNWKPPVPRQRVQMSLGDGLYLLEPDAAESVVACYMT